MSLLLFFLFFSSCVLLHFFGVFEVALPAPNRTSCVLVLRIAFSILQSHFWSIPTEHAVLLFLLVLLVSSIQYVISSLFHS